MVRIILTSTLCALALFTRAHATPGEKAIAEMKDRDGKTLGTLVLTETPQGLLITGELSGIAAGPHGFHVHAVGKCEPPFASAGGHFNPEAKRHGFHEAAGSHAGDLPNLHASSDGKTMADIMASGLVLSGGARSILDQDGASIVVHAAADDYKTDPAGNSGDRVACGVITKAQ